MALARNNEEIDRRYIELFKNTGNDMDRALGIKSKVKRGPFRRNSFVLRVRGMPFATQKPAVMEFFARKGITPLAIHFIKDQIGRPSGICYAEFASRQEQRLGHSLNREYIGSRYVEIFQSSIQELERDVQDDLPLGVITGGLGAPSRDGTQIDLKKKKDPEEEANKNQQNLAHGMMPPHTGVVPTAVSYLPNPWGVLLPPTQAALGYQYAQVPAGYPAYTIAQTQPVWQATPALRYQPHPAKLPARYEQQQQPAKLPPAPVFQTPIEESKSVFKQPADQPPADRNPPPPRPNSHPQQKKDPTRTRTHEPPQRFPPPPRQARINQVPIVYSQPLDSVTLPVQSYQTPSGKPLEPSTSVRYHPY